MANLTKSIWAKHRRKYATSSIAFLLLLGISFVLPDDNLLNLLITANAETGTYEEYQYEVQGDCVIIGSARLKDHDLFTGIIEIPAEIDGLPVTEIKAGTFENQVDLIEVIIPDSIKTIGNSAFWNCYKLEKINIPNSVTSIGWSAFHNCDSLTSVIIPDSVTVIEDSAFISCDNLSEVVIGKGVKSCVGNVFYRCDNLSKVTIGCHEIADEMFFRYELLKEVKLLDGVISIGSKAFCGCESLTEIIIPDSVTSIGDRAFSGCTGLSEVIIPDSVTSMGDHVFDNSTIVKGNNAKWAKEKRREILGKIGETLAGILALVVLVIIIGLLALAFRPSNGGYSEGRHADRRSWVERFESDTSALHGDDMYYDPGSGTYTSVDSDGIFHDEHGTPRKIKERGDGWIKDEYGRTHYSSTGRFRKGHYKDFRDWDDDDK